MHHLYVLELIARAYIGLDEWGRLDSEMHGVMYVTNEMDLALVFFFSLFFLCEVTTSKYTKHIEFCSKVVWNLCETVRGFIGILLLLCIFGSCWHAQTFVGVLVQLNFAWWYFWVNSWIYVNRPEFWFETLFCAAPFWLLLLYYILACLCCGFLERTMIVVIEFSR